MTATFVLPFLTRILAGQNELLQARQQPCLDTQLDDFAMLEVFWLLQSSRRRQAR